MHILTLRIILKMCGHQHCATVNNILWLNIYYPLHPSNPTHQKNKTLKSYHADLGVSSHTLDFLKIKFYVRYIRLQA